MINFLKPLFLLLSLFLVLTIKAELKLELPKDFVSPVQTAASRQQFSAPLKSQINGLKILRKLRGSKQYIEDPEVSEWIRTLGNKLVSRSLGSTSPFYFLVSKSTSLNAFATEGGVIVINAGLILKSDSESEVAAVLAHEIAHVSQRHITRLKAKAKNNKWGTNAALIAGVIASTKSSQAGQAIINTTIATLAHNQLAYTREAEAEADREGLRILSRAGFDPMAMPAVLQKLEQFGDNNTAGVREYLQSHPLTQRRISDTLTRAKRIGKHKGKASPAFFYTREKIRALTNSPLSTPNNVIATIKNYAMAHKLNKQKQYLKALNLLSSGSKQRSEVLLIAHLLFVTNQVKEAQNVLQSLFSGHPHSEAVAIPLAEVHIALNQADKAWQVLERVKVSEQTSLAFFETKQKVSHLTKQASQAYYASAQRNTRLSNYKVAKAQLKKAINVPGNSKNHYKMKQSLSLLDGFIEPVSIKPLEPN